MNLQDIDSLEQLLGMRECELITAVRFCQMITHLDLF